MTQKKRLPKGIEESIRLLARKYADRLKTAIAARLEEMKEDDRSHFLLKILRKLAQENAPTS